MIGIVVVSHSRALADAAVDLAEQMVDAEDRPPIGVAAGLDDGSLGTDAAAVAAVIAELMDPDRDPVAADAVLVLVDLGSAVLSAEMALEFLGRDLTGRVRLSAAPLVEGLIPAVVTAGTGGSLEAVAAEAESGLHAKTAHLQSYQLSGSAESLAEDPAAAPAADPASDEAASTIDLEVTPRHGLHARPAARLVRIVNRFAAANATIANLSTGAGPVSARSLTAVATLNAQSGHTVQVAASGPGAADLLAAVSEFAARGYGDSDSDSDRDSDRPTGARDAPADADQHRGSGLQVALGPVRRVRRGLADPGVRRALAAYRAGSAEQEVDRLRAAIRSAATDIRAAAEQAAAAVGQAEADVFDAHLALLEDPELVAAVEADLTRDRGSATRRWIGQVERRAAEFEALTDPYQRERAVDVRAVGLRVLRYLIGLTGQEAIAAEGESSIVIVDDLTPGIALALAAPHTCGVITLRGGATGHGVLLARSRGFPVLTSASQLADVPDGTVIAFDERSGLVSVDPDPDQRAQFEALLEIRSTEQHQARVHAGDTATTRDGHRILVKANIGSAEDSGFAAASGAEGAGLVRTELLFGTWLSAPSVEDQEQVFRRLVEVLEPGTVTIRTWDAGADKPLPFLAIEGEQNPFLGVRGLRPFLEEPGLLLDQLEAVCRVAATSAGIVRVMFPMVATAAELDWALDRLREAGERAGVACGAQGWPEQLQVGIMAEVPAVAFRMADLSARLDFVSIGSNDLTQYVLAADRGNAGVAYLADHADPVVLATVARISQGVMDGVQVGLCGDAAGDLALIPILIGLGVQELSVAPGAVPLVKAEVRRVAMDEARDLAVRALSSVSAEAVRDLIRTPPEVETAH